MVFLDKRAQAICDELKKLSVRQRRTIDAWFYKKGNFIRPHDAEADETPFLPFDSRIMHWYGPDAHYWFKADMTVPDSFDGRPLWLYVRTQIDEWDDGKNPQFLLYVDGEVVQGIDMNHREVLLTRSARAGQTYRLDLQSYTGTLHTEFNLIVEMQEIDPEIAGLYWDVQVPLSAFSRLEEDGASRRELTRALNGAVNLLDLRTPYSDAFYASVREAREYLKTNLYEALGGHDDVIATCIGHTHIDVAWWWTVAQTREKVCRSFATVLKLMDEYPHYRFMSSQPQLYAFLKERHPELYARIRQRVAEGRWEPEGGMWVEADCNLTSGESLVRQFIHGKRFFKGTDALLMKLDACLQLSRHEDIRALFAQLDEVRLPRGGYINYNMKKLAYAIDIKDASLAEAAWRALHKFRQSRYVLREADQLYDIYVCHKSNHIDELKNFAGKTKNPSSRAMAFFRIAKQYHYLGDADRRTEYLLKAKGAYNDPTWQKIIGDILAGDLSRLE